MAKGKMVTAEEINAVITVLDEATGEIHGMITRISNGHLGDVPNALEIARDLACVARDCNNFALRMFNAHDSNELKAKIEKLKSEQA